MITLGNENVNPMNEAGGTSGVVNLSKGGRVNLSKSKPGLKHIMVGLGWDVAKYHGQAAFDLDASVFMVNEYGKTPVQGFIFYNNLKGPDECIIHQGDNRTGEGDGDDEQIFIDLDKIPSWCTKIAITITIDDWKTKGQSFGMIENAFCRLVNNDTNAEEIRFDLADEFSMETAVVIGELYKKDGDWRFNAIGQGFNNGLEGLVNNYGLQAVYND